MRYQLSKAEIARPVDVLWARVHASRERTRPVDAPSRREPTTNDLERLGEGGLAAVTVAGRYRVERLLGRGGMASVYAAYDTVLARPVALKVLSEDYCGRPQILARFLREARLNARLHHPNIVEVLDFGSSRSGVIFLAMELLEGEDLRRTLARRSTLPWPRVRALMLQICAGLRAAHRAGIVHRDLKPSNCFRVVDGSRESICLVDFGIATSFEDKEVRERLTLTNHIIGTPEYMSPEQARGERVDHRSDIYTAGLILGEMLTGALPFSAATPPAMLAAQIYEPPPLLRSLAPAGTKIPAALESVYARALSKDPNERYKDVDEFADALRAVDAGGPTLVSGAYEACPTAPIRAEGMDKQDARGGTRNKDGRWLPYAAAASIAFLVGALGALAVASSLHPAPAAASPTPVGERSDVPADQARDERRDESAGAR